MVYLFNNFNFFQMSIFSSLPVNKPKLTPFPLGHSVKFTCQFGQEQPTVCEKVVPGDVILSQTAHRIDFAPLATKLIQEFRIKQESFFIPTRIMWKDFEDFFVEEENEIIHPYFSPDGISTYLTNFIASYLSNLVTAGEIYSAFMGVNGIITALYGRQPSNTKSASFGEDALPFFAYLTVLREYYLDENLQADLIELFSVDNFIHYYELNSGDMSFYMASIILKYVYYQLTGNVIPFGSTPSSPATTTLNKSTILQYARGFIFRNYPKDYFVSALPWKQKGNTVYIPSSQSSDVQFYIQNDASTTNDVATTPEMFMKFQNNANTGVISGYKGVNLLGARHNDPDPVENSYIRAITAAGQGVTSIEDFRTAYQVQQWLEKNARGGTRYKEQILAHFGIKTKDSRLDRPEFIYGLTDVVNHGDVFTTFQNENGDGVPAESVTRLSAGGRSKSVSYRVTEHGYFLTLYCLFPKANYMSGIKRQALELDKFDYFWPEFEHLGEQEIFKCELWSDSTQPLQTFGYTPRYSQYKSRQNVVRGEFASNLSTFTLGRVWNGANLNGLFIQIDPFRNDLNRAFNVVNANYDKIYMEVYNGLYMLRPMSYYGIPRLVL